MGCVNTASRALEPGVIRMVSVYMDVLVDGLVIHVLVSNCEVYTLTVGIEPGVMVTVYMDVLVGVLVIQALVCMDVQPCVKSLSIGYCLANIFCYNFQNY